MPALGFHAGGGDVASGLHLPRQAFGQARFFVQLAQRTVQHGFPCGQATGCQIIQTTGVGGLTQSTPPAPHASVRRQAIDMHRVTAQTQKPKGRALQPKVLGQVGMRLAAGIAPVAIKLIAPTANQALRLQALRRCLQSLRTLRHRPMRRLPDTLPASEHRVCQLTR